MRRDGVAKRYAAAVFELAREQGDFDEWASELDTLATVLSNPEVEAVLANTRVRSQEKDALLRHLLAGLRPAAINLARLLVANRRVSYAPAIRDAYRAKLDEQRGIVHARVTTAVPLSEQEKERLADRLAEITGGRVELEAAVDPAILGGLIVRIGDRLIDGSTRAKLLALRRRLQGAVA